MIPVIVFLIALIYLFLKATGLFDDLVRLGQDFDRGESTWRQKYMEWAQEDPAAQERLEVYKEFFDHQPGDDEDA